VAGAAASDRSGNKTLELTAVETQSAPLFTEGFLGSRFVGVDDLSSGTRKVGSGGRSCEVVAQGEDHSGTFQCLITLALPDGLLTLQALPTLTEQGLERFKAAVTGGTDEYRHARGEARVEEVSPTETRYTIDRR
jgi:hypothetical protein